MNGLLIDTPSLREFGSSLPKLAAGILRAVIQSFGGPHAMRIGATGHEMRRRVTYCVRLALELKHSKHWGTERIADALPAALNTHLAGGVYEPDQRAVWLGTDGD